MDTSSSGDSTPKKHARHGSSGRAALPRRSTRGPLDIGDIPIPLSASPEPPSSSSNPKANPLTTMPSLIPSASNPHSQYSTPRALSPSLPSSQPGSNLSANPSFKTAQSTLTSTPSTLSQFQPQKDFSYLLRPEIYHPLTLLDIPSAFRAVQPPANTPLPILLKTGHFRNAAIRAAQLLTSTPLPSSLSQTTPAITSTNASTTIPGDTSPLSPSDYPIIFALLYTRLSCLTLSNATALAAQESRALEDLNSSYYRDDETGKHLVPWELRVLAVRLQGIGFNDARRGVMGYYDLGQDARAQLTALYKNQSANTTDVTSVEESTIETTIDDETQASITLWRSRLHDLGILVASALIEMQDLSGAAHFLQTSFPPSTISTASSPHLPFQRALLYLHLGDVDAARACFPIVNNSADDDSDDDAGKNTLEIERRKVIDALAFMADDQFEEAVGVWRSLITGLGDDKLKLREGEKAMWMQNMGVCLLYMGRIDEARSTLESLITENHSFHALTFNLCTIYELCTERARVLKGALVEKVVAGLKSAEGGRESGEGEAGGGGWEKVNADFKL